MANSWIEATVIISLVVMLIFKSSQSSVLSYDSALNIRCTNRQSEDVTNCKYGSYRDKCGNISCYRGAGQTCDSDDDRDIKSGKCHWSLSCSPCLGICTGCLDKHCVPPQLCKPNNFMMGRN